MARRSCRAGCYGQAVGELVIRMEGRDRKVVSYDLRPVDDTIQGDPRLIKEMETFKAETSRIVFAPRGLKMDEPIVDRPRLAEHVLRPRRLAADW
jgi:5'-nucleotidase